MTSGFESEDVATTDYEFSNLRSDILKLMGADEKKTVRNIKSAVNLKPTSLSRPSSQKAGVNVRPLTTAGMMGKKGSEGNVRIKSGKYELSHFDDIFEESGVENLANLEENLLKHDLIHIKEGYEE
jgi:hypothetical protein